MCIRDSPLRYALLDFLKETPLERFGSCAICIVHNYDEALGKRRIRDYDNIETKRYLDVIESMLLTDVYKRQGVGSIDQLSWLLKCCGE